MKEALITPFPFDGKLYVNAFPKAGLHLVALMVHPLARPQPMIEGVKPWAGTFTDHSWTNNWRAIDTVLWRCSELTNGHMMYAHAAYRRELERFLWFLGAAHVFVFRDLRDVAVSQAFHVVAPDEQELMHPDKEIYRILPSFEDVLIKCIEGYCKFPGLIERWELYAPWIDVPWVQAVAFEDCIEHPRAVAEAILDYSLARRGQVIERSVEFLPDKKGKVLDEMVRCAGLTESSPTFRSGKIGDWREHFTPRVREAFREAGGDAWLVQMGYEEGEEW